MNILLFIVLKAATLKCQSNFLISLTFDAYHKSSSYFLDVMFGKLFEEFSQTILSTY